MEAHLLRVRRAKVLASRPRGHALGLLLGDLIVTLHIAQARSLPVLLIERSETRSSPLLRLQCEGIQRIVPGEARTARYMWAAAVFGDGVRHGIAGLWNATIEWAQRRVQALVVYFSSGRPLSLVSIWMRWRSRTTGAVPARASRDRIRITGAEVMRRLALLKRTRSAAGAVYESHDVRRYAALTPLTVRFSAADENEARRAAGAAGIPHDRPLATLHVRGGAGLHGASGRGKDVIRNADITTYAPAVQALVDRGFTVVRIGDPSMPPVTMPGVIDLATCAERSSLLDFWCVSRSVFFLACDSGPYLLSWLFNVPCLAVNVVNALGVYPLRPRDRYLIKRVRERATGRMVPFDEMLEEEFIYSFRRRLLKEESIELIDNSAEEIAAAAHEMADVVVSNPLPTERQLWFRSLVARARAGTVSRSKLFEKLGRDDTYLGDGWIVDAFVARQS